MSTGGQAALMSIRESLHQDVRTYCFAQQHGCDRMIFGSTAFGAAWLGGNSRTQTSQWQYKQLPEFPQIDDLLSRDPKVEAQEMYKKACEALKGVAPSKVGLSRIMQVCTQS